MATKSLFNTMTLIQGDCIEEMKKLKDNSIDLLFCDLPYAETSCHWDCLIDLSQFWKEVNRICKVTTPMFFTCTTKFGVSLINSNPKNFRYDMVWIKSSPCGFLNAKKMPMRKHEMLYVFYRKLPFYDLSSHAYSATTSILTERQSSDKECYDGAISYNYEKRNGVVYNPPLPNSILEIKSEKGKHPTQKPTALIEWCLKYFTKEGDTVLDPTAGSGSTGVACKKMNRQFIGIEKDEEIYKIMVSRV
jgi:site-specific DNA-methyltransferase (adenine-specific)